jgi:hypothetical protein
MQLHLQPLIPSAQADLPPFLFPGVYTIDNGGGGADVGPFSAPITIPTTVVWSNSHAVKDGLRNAI